MENNKIYNEDCLITERIKTFEDACDKLGENDVLVAEYKSFIRDKITYSDDVIAYLKLRIICAALNEGWKPTFNGDELHYFPWFDIYTKREYEELDENKKKKFCTVSRSGSKANADGGFRLCECDYYVIGFGYESLLSACLQDEKTC